MEKKYYFLHTVYVSGRQRLRALDGQTFESGERVDPLKNISSDKVLRAKYPIGTIFVAEYLEDKGSFYAASSIKPMEPADGYKSEEDKPSSDAILAWHSFSPTATEGEHHEDTSKKMKSSKKGTLLERLSGNPNLKKPSIHKEGFYVDSDEWYLLLRNLTNNVNTMLIGPTGTGKTELVMLACQKLGVKCSVYDMGSMYDPVAGLLGVHRLRKGGESVFDYAKFTKDIQEPGVVLLDELSRAPVTTNNILFPCLDSRRSLPVEIAGGDDLRSIKVHENCCFVATANIGAEYTGTMSMDRALTCRFFPIELSYLDINNEAQLLSARCHISNVDAMNISKIANKIRKMYESQDISSNVSTRETLMVGDLIADGWTTTRAMEVVFLPLFEGTTMEGERSIVLKTIMSA